MWTALTGASLILLVMLAVYADAAEQKGAITVAPVRPRTLQDILQELTLPIHNQDTGKIIALDGTHLVLQRKDGTLLSVEFSTAARSAEFPPIGTGKSITAIGRLDPSGTLHAQVIFRADQ